MPKDLLHKDSWQAGARIETSASYVPLDIAWNNTIADLNPANQRLLSQGLMLSAVKTEPLNLLPIIMVSSSFQDAGAAEMFLWSASGFTGKLSGRDR